MPWCLLLSVAAGLGAARFLDGLSTRLGEVSLRPVFAGAACALILVGLPDLAWGIGGRLTPVTYPADYDVVRQVLLQDPRPGDVLVLPWRTYRRFAWNRDTPVLDPAPRYLPRTSVADESLVVSTPHGLVTVTSENPRSAAVAAALPQGTFTSALARSWGIGWDLVEGDQPGVIPALDGTAIPLGSPGSVHELRLIALAGGGSRNPWQSPMWRVVLVGCVDVAAAGLVLWSGWRLVSTFWRRRRATVSMVGQS